jgi:heavy metal translocating P-type ATPase
VAHPARVRRVDEQVAPSAREQAKGSKRGRTEGWSWVWSAITPALALAVLLAGGTVRLASSEPATSATIWMTGLVITGIPVVWRTARGAVSGHLAADLVASLAILAAVWLREPVAGLVIVIMQTGGETLERYAEGRASEAVRALEAAAPRVAHRLDGTRAQDITTAEIAIGDLLLIRPGELVPCNATVIDGRSHVDVSRLTGEPLPITATPGTKLLSGTANGEGTLIVRALATAEQSEYAQIVALVRSAQASKAPLQRLADRYAVWFTPFVLIVCLLAYALTRDPVRVLAVLVVATPCPLILAVPTAIIGGINRAARQHIIVRSGEALERLATVRVAVFDKTGTLTIGRPEVSRVTAIPPFTEHDVLRLAGAVEQGSSHLLARTLVEAAEAAHVPLDHARNVVEAAGRGVSGKVAGHVVTVGARSFVLERHPEAGADFDQPSGTTTRLRAYVAVDGRLAGLVDYADRIRPELHATMGELAELGISRIILLSGDHAENANAVAALAGIREVASDLLPEDKVTIVRRLVSEGHAVVMVGDGVNDAPALSSATVGIALASHGGGITAESADVVVLADDLGRVPEAIRIGRRAIGIARQSAWVGLGLSGGAMVLAAWGLIPPAIGALLQEGIDVAVIVNALRASRA